MDTASPFLSLFSSDYATARERFRKAAQNLGWELSAHPIGAGGPDGDELTVDVAISPGSGTPDDAAFVLSSGLHGVEGFFGSALQLGSLEKWKQQRNTPPPVRCVLLHALNPFGFAWRRRVNEDNVDVNRNLLLAEESYRGCPDVYRELNGLLNPERPPSPFEPVTAKFMLPLARYGMRALKQAIAAGQYDYPRGLFYGGDRPTATHRLLAANLEQWLGASRRVVHLDVHTGLGAWGSYKLLIDYPLDARKRDRLAEWFGKDAFEVSDASVVAYSARGNLGRWCYSRFAGRDYVYAAAEFGTYSGPVILAGLRAENQAHHWGAPDTASTQRAKQKLVELFCPGSLRWRTTVMEQGLQLVDRAIKGLVSAASDY